LALRYPRAGLEELWRSLSKRAFVEAARRLVPAIEAEQLVVAPAGIRAQAVTMDGKLLDDFAFHESPYVLSVINAPSPAATASLELGKIIAQRARERASLTQTL
jgi:L-2-hydroxyglutarate oxidase